MGNQSIFFLWLCVYSHPDRPLPYWTILFGRNEKKFIFVSKCNLLRSRLIKTFFVFSPIFIYETKDECSELGRGIFTIQALKAVQLVPVMQNLLFREITANDWSRSSRIRFFGNPLSRTLTQQEQISFFQCSAEPFIKLGRDWTRHKNHHKWLFIKFKPNFNGRWWIHFDILIRASSLIKIDRFSFRLDWDERAREKINRQIEATTWAHSEPTKKMESDHRNESNSYNQQIGVNWAPQWNRDDDAVDGGFFNFISVELRCRRRKKWK